MTLKYFKARRKNLRNLSLSCKQVGAVAQPFMHHTYGFIENYDRTIYKFCRTISQRPDLARSVQSINLKHPGRVQSGWYRSRELDWIVPVVTRLSSRLTLDLTALNDLGRRDSLIERALPAVTLLQLSKLKELIVRGKDDWYLLGDIKTQAEPGSQCHILPELRWLSVSVPALRDPPRLLTPTLPLSISNQRLGGDLSSFANLQSLNLWRVMNSCIPQNLRLPKVNKLSLRNTVLGKEGLRRIVHATGNLRSFQYSEIQGLEFLEIPILDGGEGTAATSHDIFSVLEAKKDTLWHVVVHTYYRGETDQMNEPGQNLEPLSQLKGLRVLELNIRSFCDPAPFVESDTYPDNDVLVGHLPSSLMALRISSGPSGMKRILPGLEDFCKDTKEKPIRQSALNLVRIKFEITMEEENYEHVNDADDHNIDLTPWDWNREKEREFNQKCPKWVDKGKREFSVWIEVDQPEDGFI